MPITAVQSSAMMGEPSSAPDSSADLPAWMVARRERQPASEVGQPTEDLGAQITFQTVEAPESLIFSPALPRRKAKAVAPVIAVTDPKRADSAAGGNWLTRWISSQGLIGMGVSLLIHTSVLIVLAFVIISNVSKHEDMSLWGVVDTGDEVGGNIVLDASMPLDTGESSPLQVGDLTDVLQATGLGDSVAETVRKGTGGNGKSDGDSGEGASVGVPSLKVPGYAQTKGSFTAWPEPRDPRPLQNYYVVIQVRLPRAAKKYRASDLTGLVTGTDKYKQEIRYKAGESFEIVDGVVEIRVLVPGGAQRVRDTVFIESKLLREKQTFEIEF